MDRINISNLQNGLIPSGTLLIFPTNNINQEVRTLKHVIRIRMVPSSVVKFLYNGQFCEVDGADVVWLEDDESGM